MRLIFLNRFFYPDHSATSQMLTDLAFGLAERGLDVAVVTSRLRYDEPNARLAPRETVNGVRIERIWTSRFGRAGLLFRAVDYATFYVSVVWSLAWTVKRGDIVIAMTDPPALSVVAAVVARWRGARLVNWLQDVFPEVAEALAASAGLSSALFAPLRILRNASLRHADMNVAIGPLMARRLQSSARLRDRVAVVPNWADTRAVRPVPAAANKLYSEWNLAGEFVVGYSGNLGRAHDAGTLLGAIAATARSPEVARKIRWLFVGGGVLYERLRCEVERCGYGHVTFYPYQPREALAESLSAADVHIVSLRPELEGLVVPSKFYGIAAAGRPMLFIGSGDGEIARLIARYGCGATVVAGDIVALVAAVTAMAASAESCRAMGDRARRMCEENFCKATAIATWHELLGSVACATATDARIVSRATPPIKGCHEP